MPLGRLLLLDHRHDPAKRISDVHAGPYTRPHAASGRDASTHGHTQPSPERDPAPKRERNPERHSAAKRERNPERDSDNHPNSNTHTVKAHYDEIRGWWQKGWLGRLAAAWSALWKAGP